MDQPFKLNEKEIAEYKLKELERDYLKASKSENMILAKLGMLYGSELLIQALNNEIDYNTMLWLVECGEQIEKIKQYDTISLIASALGSVNSKKGAESFKKIMENMKKEIDNGRNSR